MDNYTIDESTGCWVWSGATCSGGRYGRLPGPKPMKMAHRHSYKIHKGAIPPGMMVCHTCDNGLCVNPEHLFLGTGSDNMKDAVRKGRVPMIFGGNGSQAGERNANAKLTPWRVKEIREYYQKTNCTFGELAQKFQLKSRGHAHAIVNRLIWK